MLGLQDLQGFRYDFLRVFQVWFGFMTTLPPAASLYAIGSRAVAFGHGIRHENVPSFCLDETI